MAVKHALTPEGFDLVTAAQDCASRGGADALVITGKSTGSEIDTKDLQTVRAALPHTPLLAGSGITADNATRFLDHADGCIVGTSLKKGGKVEEAVDEDRVRELVEAVRAGDS